MQYSTVLKKKIFVCIQKKERKIASFRSIIKLNKYLIFIKVKRSFYFSKMHKIAQKLLTELQAQVVPEHFLIVFCLHLITTRFTVMISIDKRKQQLTVSQCCQMKGILRLQFYAESINLIGAELLQYLFNQGYHVHIRKSHSRHCTHKSKLDFFPHNNMFRKQMQFERLNFFLSHKINFTKLLNTHTVDFQILLIFFPKQ